MTNIIQYRRKKSKKKPVNDLAFPVKRRLVLRLSKKMVLILAIVIVGMIWYVYNSNSQIRKKLIWERENLHKQIEILQEEIKSLEDKVQLLQTDTGVEKEARDRLNLVKPGERLLRESD